MPDAKYAELNWRALQHSANEWADMAINGRWQSPTLHFQELEAIQLLLDLHHYQIKQLSFAEFRRAYDLTVAHIRTARTPLVQLGKGAIAC